MNRRRALAALLGAAVLTPGGAAAQDDAERRIRRQLRAQGFRIVERSRTLLGRVRIVARGDGTWREIILDPRTGVILRDYTRPLGQRGRDDDDDDD